MRPSFKGAEITACRAWLARDRPCNRDAAVLDGLYHTVEDVDAIAVKTKNEAAHLLRMEFRAECHSDLRSTQGGLINSALRVSSTLRQAVR